MLSISRTFPLSQTETANSTTPPFSLPQLLLYFLSLWIYLFEAKYPIKVELYSIYVMLGITSSRCIHVVAHLRISFILKAKYFVVGIYHILYIQSSLHTHWGCFQFQLLWIMLLWTLVFDWVPAFKSFLFISTFFY